MTIKKRLLGALLAGILLLGSVCGCGDPDETDAQSDAPVSEAEEEYTGSTVYFLNFKPECDEQWKSLGKKYTEMTGVRVIIETVTTDDYADIRAERLAQENPPTLFQINGPSELKQLSAYCLDLSDTELYRQLVNSEYALMKDNEVKAVAYVIETYGIIYNRNLLQMYFDKSYAAAKSVDEIRSFDKLKEVCDDIQAHKEDLGVKGAFASSGLDDSSSWRFTTHLANLPIYYEYKKDGITSTDAIKGTYLDGFRKIWDLYITDSTCDPKELPNKTDDDALTDFINGYSVFYQNGSWDYYNCINGGFVDVGLGILPIYIGAEGEEKQGLCTGSENYLCINAKASPDDIKATKDFVNWLLTSDDGKSALAVHMGFKTPFKSMESDEYASNNYFTNTAEQLESRGRIPVEWSFTTIPGGDKWKDPLCEALKSYSVNGMTDAEWEKVRKAFVDGWKTQADAEK